MRRYVAIALLTALVTVGCGEQSPTAPTSLPGGSSSLDASNVSSTYPPPPTGADASVPSFAAQAQQDEAPTTSYLRWAAGVATQVREGGDFVGTLEFSHVGAEQVCFEAVAVSGHTTVSKKPESDAQNPDSFGLATVWGAKSPSDTSESCVKSAYGSRLIQIFPHDNSVVQGDMRWIIKSTQKPAGVSFGTAPIVLADDDMSDLEMRVKRKGRRGRVRTIFINHGRAVYGTQPGGGYRIAALFRGDAFNLPGEAPGTGVPPTRYGATVLPDAGGTTWSWRSGGGSGGARQGGRRTSAVPGAFGNVEWNCGEGTGPPTRTGTITLTTQVDHGRVNLSISEDGRDMGNVISVCGWN